MNDQRFYLLSLIGAMIISFLYLSDNKQNSNRLNESWAPNTKIQIEELIKNNSGNPGAYAVFDWDNTSIFGDVQENLFVYQLENLIFKLTPEEFNYAFIHHADNDTIDNKLIPATDFSSPYLNNEKASLNINQLAEDCTRDYSFIYENYRAINPASRGNLTLEQIKKTPQYKNFIAKMYFTYSALYESFPSNIAYTWVIYVTATGFTSEELKSVVEKSIDWGISQKIARVYFNSDTTIPGTAGIINNSEIGNYFSQGIRPIKEIASLFNLLDENKIPVYICTASLQDVVEVFAENSKYGYSLPQNRVIGMRLKKNADGKFIPYYDNSDGYAVNGNEGKTININSLLVKKYASNPIIIAGDSDGDYNMITELSGMDGKNIINNYKPVELVLLINRLKSGVIGRIGAIGMDQLFHKKLNSTKVVLQGRDENYGKWIPTEKTIKFENIKQID
jgi:hypothetical protein